LFYERKTVVLIQEPVLKLKTRKMFGHVSQVLLKHQPSILKLFGKRLLREWTGYESIQEFVDQKIVKLVEIAVRAFNGLGWLSISSRTLKLVHARGKSYLLLG